MLKTEKRALRISLSYLNVIKAKLCVECLEKSGFIGTSTSDLWPIRKVPIRCKVQGRCSQFLFGTLVALAQCNIRILTDLRILTNTISRSFYSLYASIFSLTWNKLPHNKTEFEIREKWIENWVCNDVVWIKNCY